MKKYYYTLLLVMLCCWGCKEKTKPYEIRRTFIFGTDTLDLDNCVKVNGDKWHTGHFNGNGHNDTVNRVFYDTFRVQCHDTVFIHDTIYTTKHYGNVENLIIGPKPSPIPDTSKPIKKKIDSTGIVLAKAYGFPEYDRQHLLIFNKKGEPFDYCDSLGWIVSNDFRPTHLPKRFSPATIDSIVNNSESPFKETKPIKDKIKMQPRWRGSAEIIYEGTEIDWQRLTVKGTDSVSLGGTIEYNTTINRDSLVSLWTDPTNISRGSFTITGVSKIDTTKVIMLVADTLSTNGFRSSRCFWMYGYDVRGITVKEETKDGFIFSTNFHYLDESKKELPKNFVVWMSKELKP